MVSTHDPDEITFFQHQMVNAKGTLTVIAPRHIKRSKEISNLLNPMIFLQTYYLK